MDVEDLGVMEYRPAWDYQEQVHAQVVAGAPERLLLVEHPPVITLGRRPGVIQNLVASEADLVRLGVQKVQSDRGGDITFHGPGQLVAYPIVRLNEHGLSVGGYVRLLQEAIIELLHHFEIPAQRDPDAVGVWVPNAERQLAKICAIGVRIRRGISMHGLALNVTTDLDYFNLIIPCGLAGRPVTSMAAILAEKTPPMPQIRQELAQIFKRKL